MGTSKLDNALHYEAKTSWLSVSYGKICGNGKIEIRQLPDWAQISNISNSSCDLDFWTMDGIKDIVVAG